MKRILAAITTIVIAVGLAITGVSTANAEDAAAPIVSTTETPSTPIPVMEAAPPAPLPEASDPPVTPPPSTPPVTPSPAARVAAPDPVYTPALTPSTGPCLAASAASYVYNPSTNSGTVTVAARPYSSALLCSPIYITAASWKYTKAAVWPQVLDAANYVTVDKVGTYAYGAAVTCGQGDIYARTVSSIVPTATLAGPQGWEKFLSGMGLKTSTPGNTYVQSPVGCVHSEPIATVVTGQCYWDGEQGVSFKSVTIQYDNRKSNVPVDFSVKSDLAHNVDYSGYTRDVAAGGLVEVTLPASRTGGVSYSVLAAGTTTTLQVPYFEACPPEIPTLPLIDPTAVTFIDTCGVEGDKVTIPTLTGENHFTYSTTDSAEGRVRTVTVIAVANKGYGFDSDAVTSWSHTFATDYENNCVTVPGDPEAVGETCAVDADGVVSGYLMVAVGTGVTYTIRPVNPAGADIAVTGPKTDVAPGDYLVIAKAKPGFILSGVTEWERTVANNAEECSPPTLAFLPSSVSWVGQTCSTSGTVSGYIAIDPTDFLSYFVGTTQLVSARTAFAPGTYVVTVVAPPGDTIDGPSTYTATITKSNTSCGNLDPQSLTTLAFTGFDSGAGYLAVASALLLLGAALVFGARRAAKS